MEAAKAAFRATRHAGFCAVTPADPGDCDHDGSGSWGLEDRMQSIDACAERCALCANCRYISFSFENRECSWYKECPGFPHALQRSGSSPSGSELYGAESYRTRQLTRRLLAGNASRSRRAAAVGAGGWGRKRTAKRLHPTVPSSARV